MSLPRVLSLGDDGTLRVEPVRELETLRQGHRQLGGQPVAADSCFLLDEVQGDAYEIIAEFELGSADEVGIKLRHSPGGEEQTVITYSRDGGYLALDAERSSVSREVVSRGVQRASMDLGMDEPLRLHVFVDRSVVEVFGNRKVCLTKRVYPSRPDSLGVRVFANGGGARLRTLDWWEVASIW